MDNWRSLIAVVVFCALLEICHGLPSNSETRTSDDGQYGESEQDESLDSEMADMVKRSKALRFYGLMGKRSGSTQPIQLNRRRNKGEMFVGLMGRSITSGESLTQMVPVGGGPAVVSEDSREVDWQEDRVRPHYHYG